jgi:hypothetical protein
MTTHEIQSLVTEAVLIDRQIAVLKDQLAVKKSILVELAKSRPAEQAETANGGASWTAEGRDGLVARVTFPADKLGSIDADDSKLMEKVRKVAGLHFRSLFHDCLTYKPIKEFRGHAVDLLGAAAGRKLIGLCSSESSPRVNFETKSA